MAIVVSCGSGWGGARSATCMAMRRRISAFPVMCGLRSASRAALSLTRFLSIWWDRRRGAFRPKATSRPSSTCAGERRETLVVESEQVDDGLDVAFGLNAPRRRSHQIDKNRVRLNAALLAERNPQMTGKAEMRRRIAMQVADLAPPHPEPQLTTIAMAGGHTGPGRDDVDDLSAGAAGVGRHNRCSVSGCSRERVHNTHCSCAVSRPDWRVSR